MRLLPLVCGFAGFLIACQARADGLVVAERPLRSFGYVIGDTLERHITLTASDAVELEASSLPHPGKQSSWLVLLDVRPEPTPGVRSTHHTVELRYQIRNAPTETRPIVLPAFALRFRDARERVEVPISESRVTVAPIIPANQVPEALSQRPDRPPQPLSVAPDLRRLILFAVVALTLIAYGMLIPQLALRRAPFARAYRHIRRAAHDVESSHRYREALRALHRAFDETAGAPVFADRLEEFFAERPWFADLRGPTDNFLMMSRREFFADSASAADSDIAWLLEFSRACHLRERRAR